MLNAVVCRNCNPPHVENCPECFGYGFDLKGNIVSAGRSEDMRNEMQITGKINFPPCSVCYGDIFNFDIDAFYGDGISPEPIGILDVTDNP